MSASVRVLCVIDSIMLGGGAERLLVSLLAPLRARGVHVDVAPLRSLAGDLGSEVERAGARVHQLDIYHRWSAAEAVYKVARILASGAYNVAWGHLYFGNLYATLAARAARTPSVITLHNAGEFREPGSRTLWPRTRHALESKVGEWLATRRVAVSNSVRANYMELTGWGSIDVIRNGVPTSRLPPDLSSGKRREVRASLGVGDEDFLIAVVGRLITIKGYSTLLESLGLLAADGQKRPKVAIFGQGPLAAELHRTIQRAGLAADVRLHGAVPQARVFEAVQSADAFVQPSWREAFGIAAAEAMALGVPTIVSGVDGLLELAGEESAIVVPPRNSTALARAIRQLMAERTTRSKLAANGRDRVRSIFDIEAVAAQWADLFHQVCP